jgi:hypothetical protein
MKDYKSQYLRAIYFVVTTFSTVGYGDISGTNRNEYIYAFCLLISSQLLFSYFSEKLRRILSDTEKTKITNVKLELLETTKLFLVQVSKVKGARPMKQREIKGMLEYLDAGFQYNFRSLLLKGRFFSKLSTRLQKKLIFHIMGHYRDQFPFFFDDFEHRYQSGEDFQFHILSNMECLILPPHDGNLTMGDGASAIVRNPTDSVDYLYFVHIGSVNVFDKNDRFMVKYMSGSFFGDFQLILGLRSGYRYVGSSNRTNYLFQIKKAIFLKAFYDDYDSMVYLTKIALQRRKFMKRKVAQLNAMKIEHDLKEAIRDQMMGPHHNQPVHGALHGKSLE